ncbi:response regulator [Deltaproteobacteria bacterium TL4]
MANIFIIGVNKSMLEQIEIWIKEIEHTTRYLSASPGWVEALDHENIELILLGNQDSTLSTIDMLNAIKNHTSTHTVPVIMITDESAPMILRACFDQGASDYLLLPVEEHLLKSRILSALNTHKNIRQLHRIKDELQESLEIQHILNDNLLKASQELKLTQKQLFQAQKMEAIGTLAGGVAHEFNNILFAMLGYTEIVIQELDDRPMLKECLKQVLDAGKKGKDLVRQILTFSRRRSQEQKQFMDLVPLFKEIVKLLKASLPSSIVINSSIHINEAHILAIPDQMHQVLMNLCSNAIDAIGDEGGTLTLSINEYENIEKYSNILQKKGSYYEISVHDTGCGIPKEIQDKIFDPFFTTKPVTEGTGMGLSVADGIIRDHHGVIQVKSEPQYGTRFLIYLPKAQAVIVEDMDHSISITGTESILLVDSEEILLTMETLALEKLGYLVTSTSSSLEALDMIRTTPHSFDLVITDQMMAHLTGLRLAEQIRRLKKKIPVILVTGYSEMFSEEALKKAGIKASLEKPVDLNILAQKIREILDEVVMKGSSF